MAAVNAVDAPDTAATERGNTVATLHCIYDPLCGWCYAAAPLIEAAHTLKGLSLQLRGGGMMAGSNRRPITPQWRKHVMPHDQRIAQLTGQPFGQGYFEGLLWDEGAMLDSAPPITAVLAAEAMAARGHDMLQRLQRAHYVEGQRISEAAVLQGLAAELSLDGSAFAQAFDRLSGPATQAHIDASRQLLSRARGQGFPTFALERGDGHLELLDMGVWLGSAPEAWREHLRAQVDRARLTPQRAR